VADHVQLAEGDAPAAAPPPGGGGGTPQGDREIEELVRKIYPRLRHRLAGELLVSRERAGYLADAG
jgi:hypothetical protein